MAWLSRLKWWRRREPVARADVTFVRRNWDEHFGNLAPESRQTVATNVCRRVSDTAPLQGADVDRAIATIAQGQEDSHVLLSIRSLVERTEDEYESLVGGDESKLSSSDPEVRAAFVRARAAATLQCALEGDLVSMAYEAWFVLDDLGELRRLAGISLDAPSPP